MSKERELLTKVEYWYSYEFPEGDLYTTIKAIRELLAQPEDTEQEPVTLNAKDTELSIYEVCFSTMVELRDLKQSLLKREPLSEGIICLIYDTTDGSEEFARAIEKAHGIVGEQYDNN